MTSCAVAAAHDVAAALEQFRRGAQAIYGDRLTRLLFIPTSGAAVQALLFLRGVADPDSESRRIRPLQQQLAVDWDLAVQPEFRSEE